MFARSPGAGMTERSTCHKRGVRKQLIEQMVGHTESPKGEAEKHLEAFTMAISGALKAGEEVQIPGFGKFYVRD
jgi:DNA-binding protein HU-beta